MNLQYECAPHCSDSVHSRVLCSIKINRWTLIGPRPSAAPEQLSLNNKKHANKVSTLLNNKELAKRRQSVPGNVNYTRINSPVILEPRCWTPDRPGPLSPRCGSAWLASGARTRPCSLTVSCGDAQDGAVMSPARSGARETAGKHPESAAAPAARSQG